MKKRINLFSRKKRFDVFAVYAGKIRLYGTLFGVFLFIIFMLVIYQVYTIQLSIRDLTKKKQLYLSVLLDEKDIEANIRYFKGKQTQLITFEKDDAHFKPYYNVLVSVLSTASNSGALDRVEIDKNRNTAFVVKFSDYKTMLAFLKYVESPDFLKNFDSLSLSSLSLSRNPSSATESMVSNIDQNRNYQLQFKGKFKQLNDKPGQSS